VASDSYLKEAEMQLKSPPDRNMPAAAREWLQVLLQLQLQLPAGILSQLSHIETQWVEALRGEPLTNDSFPSLEEGPAVAEEQKGPAAAEEQKGTAVAEEQKGPAVAPPVAIDELKGSAISALQAFLAQQVALEWTRNLELSSAVEAQESQLNIVSDAASLGARGLIPPAVRSAP